MTVLSVSMIFPSMFIFHVIFENPPNILEFFKIIFMLDDKLKFFLNFQPFFSILTYFTHVPTNDRFLPQIFYAKISTFEQFFLFLFIVDK